MFFKNLRNHGSKKHILNIIGKEWKLAFTTPSTALFITLLPIIIIFQALLYIYLIMRFAGAGVLMKTFLGGVMSEWIEMFSPESIGFSINDRFAIFFLAQFPFYMLLIPAMVAVSLAAFSIVEEKQAKTLEPLLATPVRTWELLMGKALAGTIPSIIICWFCALLVFIILWIIGKGHLLTSVLNIQWYISLFILVPIVSLLTFMLGVIGSSRAKDVKSAQNLAVFVILPILGLMVVQLSGIFFFTLPRLILLVITFIIVNLIVLRISVKVFDRESIIIKW